MTNDRIGPTRQHALRRPARRWHVNVFNCLHVDHVDIRVLQVHVASAVVAKDTVVRIGHRLDMADPFDRDWMQHLDLGADGGLNVEPPIRVICICVRVVQLWFDSEWLLACI